ncbi:MAG: glycerol-3-phosphate acyltransferase [Candidatus Omnitrophica bacterium]|nr:glycerol-3-phosphate acyltransferase [Candidatus Omnitrophota bacterium]
MVFRIFGSFVFAYLLGSIPFAYLIAKLVKGVDIRRIGTGNPGAANVFREVGKPWGILVWIFDTGKGAATSGGAVLYLAPKLFPLVLLLYFFVQRKGPRSAPLLLLAIVVFFVFLIFLYPHCYQWLVPAVLFLIGIGAFANISAIKEMKR